MIFKYPWILLVKLNVGINEVRLKFTLFDNLINYYLSVSSCKNNYCFGEVHPNQTWACFVHYPKILNIVLKNNMIILIILKQIFWEISKMAFKYWVIDQNLQNTVSINN